MNERRYDMTKRFISAIIALVVFIPILLQGGQIFDLAVYIISLLALKEFLDVKCLKKKIPSFIQFISYLFLTLLILFNSMNQVTVFSIDLRIIASLFLTLLVPTVLYHDQQKYSIQDAFYLIGGILFLSISISLFILIRNKGTSLLIYLFLITIMTDTYAYITGILIGKHTLLESISPNKTWEGLIVGTCFGVIIASMFYHYVIAPDMAWYWILTITFFLCLIGQFGDLVFSAIKRYFGKKDFSNIMPGHGGVLDRLDSIIFVLLGYMFLFPFL